LIISAAAKRIKEVNGNDVIKIKYAPPDLDNRRQETGKSALDIFREHGEHCIKANNRRVDGWLAVKEWLAPYETVDEQTGEKKKTARLRIFDNCVNLIDSLEQAVKDESDPNDVATEPHEVTHSIDSIRYFCIMRQRPTPIEVQKKKYNFDFEKQLYDKDYDPYFGGEPSDGYIGG
jgi:phage terminase large subunit